MPVSCQSDLIDAVDSSSHQELIRSLSHKIDRVRSDIKKIAVKISDGSAILPESSPSPTSIRGGEYSDIPLNPRKEDYKKINHWTSDTWTKWRHCKREDLPQDISGPITAQYFEDPSGKIISSSHRAQVKKDAKSIIQGMHNRNIPLGPIRSVSFDVRDEYRKRIEELHPWLRFCCGSWKAEQIWTDIYTDWKPSDPGAGKQRAKREHPTGCIEDFLKAENFF